MLKKTPGKTWLCNVLFITGYQPGSFSTGGGDPVGMYHLVHPDDYNTFTQAILTHLEQVGKRNRIYNITQDGYVEVDDSQVLRGSEAVDEFVAFLSNESNWP